MSPRFASLVRTVVAGFLFSTGSRCFAVFEASVGSVPAADGFMLVDSKVAAPILTDSNDYPTVQVAADLFASDVERVTGRKPARGGTAEVAVMAGTLGHSPLIDGLAAAGKLAGVNKIRGQWEATLWQIVDNPSPGVKRALVIAGSDRRGTAYGLMRLSEKIGVSPWYWWADVPVRRQSILAVKIPEPQTDSPGVKYRGIFINDEDFGINAWAKTTFDPQFGNIGPKTYEKVFELMLRLRLNYIWPAMHGVSTEFGSVPENYQLADKYGIVAGASHCEPLLCNNVKWNEKERGPWDYTKNRDAIHSYWEDMVKVRAGDEAVWTIGIRGIHDAAMEGPKDIPTRIATMTQVIHDERDLLSQYVTKSWGPVAQCFVPYKEVQPIYDAGLEVPPDVTLVWADDNFGYTRRLSSEAERQRPGGAGIYYHLSYWGSPHSYLWINTTAPALMWEELHKAWENQARTIWMLNVGDIKPAEIGITFYSQLAWDPGAAGPGSQPKFLRSFAASTFGETEPAPIANLLADYYRLGTIRKPELMDRAWTLALPADRAAELVRNYEDLLTQDSAVASKIPSESRDAYTEMIGFPAHVLAKTGLLFMADRKSQMGENADANDAKVNQLRDELTAEVDHYNTKIAGGKWNHMMPGLTAGKTANFQVRWPWTEKPGPLDQASIDAEKLDDPGPDQAWLHGPTMSPDAGAGHAGWTVIDGLGSTGKAFAMQPATLGAAPHDEVEFQFDAVAGDTQALIDFLPTFRLVPGMQMRVFVRVDQGAVQAFEVPGSSGREDENGSVRKIAVQDNSVRLRIPMPGLKAGSHSFTITSADPGVVIQRIALPGKP